LKALAKRTGAFVVLFGTYDLIPLLGLNGQVARRFASVHLPRYRCDEPNQWRDFQTAVRTLEAEIHLADPVELVPQAETLYRGSTGCIGILKSWLTATYSQALRAGESTMTKELLQSNRLPTLSLRKIAEEIAEGENHWSKSRADDRELDRILGLSPVQTNGDETRPPNSRRVPVGTRKPTRDPIGLKAATV
jgi:hypothetical protein